MFKVVEVSSENGVVDGVQQLVAGRADDELCCYVRSSGYHHYIELKVPDFWRGEPDVGTKTLARLRH